LSDTANVTHLAFDDPEEGNPYRYQVLVYVWCQKKLKSPSYNLAYVARLSAQPLFTQSTSVTYGWTSRRWQRPRYHSIVRKKPIP